MRLDSDHVAGRMVPVPAPRLDQTPECDPDPRLTPSLAAHTICKTGLLSYCAKITFNLQPPSFHAPPPVPEYLTAHRHYSPRMSQFTAAMRLCALLAIATILAVVCAVPASNASNVISARAPSETTCRGMVDQVFCNCPNEIHGDMKAGTCSFNARITQNCCKKHPAGKHQHTTYFRYWDFRNGVDEKLDLCLWPDLKTENQDMVVNECAQPETGFDLWFKGFSYGALAFRWYEWETGMKMTFSYSRTTNWDSVRGLPSVTEDCLGWNHTIGGFLSIGFGHLRGLLQGSR
ncbi:hypothetical protein BDV96DRAFT_603895 [Lophiotrema nucula]|uniref:Uncharacterized protein n=1 Tax=Lophiotrema nucula TaxID=690887 RepID=A0A6A5YTD9_9PLEO|nr:hypothetical protein BDV96DRAFT_603895 [Lophiotrema nucula]